jgi:hypothetical protein
LCIKWIVVLGNSYIYILYIALKLSMVLQCYQMVHFQTKNPNLGKFRKVLWWEMLVYLMSIWYILCPFGIFYVYLVYFMSIWYILWPFGIFYGHLVYFMAIWYILWLFGIFSGYLVYLFPFRYVVSRKIWQPCGPCLSLLHTQKETRFFKVSLHVM